MLLVDTKVDVKYENGGVRNMERIPNAVCTKEFREEAVMMVTEGGLTVPEVARKPMNNCLIKTPIMRRPRAHLVTI
jgi:hypothetical protein